MIDHYDPELRQQVSECIGSGGYVLKGVKALTFSGKVMAYELGLESKSSQLVVRGD